MNRPPGILKRYAVSGAGGALCFIVHVGLTQLGLLALSQGDTVQADDWLGQSLTFARKKERKDLVTYSLIYLGSLALDQGMAEQASRAYAEALALSQEIGDRISQAIASYGLGKAEYARCNWLSAQAYYLEALDLGTDQAWSFWNPAMAIEALAFVAVDQQQFDRAAWLLGASEAWHVKFQRMRTPRERQDREGCISTVRASMSETAFDAAWAEGVATSSIRRWMKPGKFDELRAIAAESYRSTE